MAQPKIKQTMLIYAAATDNFTDWKTNQINLNPKKTIHFGLLGVATYIDHKDIIKRKHYFKRHAVREDWNHVNAGSLSAFVLWGPTTSITENLVKYLEHFGIDY